MKNSVIDVRDICKDLTADNKRYVIAVATALLFSQKKTEQTKDLGEQTA